jgi:predicted DNA-binding transcriptional regulator YafY
VHAVHTNVSALRWSGTGPTVDADALAVLALACRDSEQVRFDYRRRDGEETQRLVEPHNLVSVGRRWYLVGWDVRRADWRTFRLDRLDTPRLGGVRFRPRALPADDAAAFVAASISSMPVAYETTVMVGGAVEDVRLLIRYADTDLTAVDEAHTRVRIRAENRTWALTVIAMLATEFDVRIEHPRELASEVARLGTRLRRTARA